jgi:transcriptional regulator with XRE-family HTH domain
MDIEKTLMKELKKTKISQYIISQYTGIDAATLSRFVKGERSISLKNAEKLLSFFGYSWAKATRMPLLPPPKKRGRPKKAIDS